MSFQCSDRIHKDILFLHRYSGVGKVWERTTALFIVFPTAHSICHLSAHLTWYCKCLCIHCFQLWKYNLLWSLAKQAYLSILLKNTHSLRPHFQDDNLWQKAAVKSYLHAFTAMDWVAEPVPPIHEDSVQQQSQRLHFSHVYILEDFKKCLCVPATFKPKPKRTYISNCGTQQLSSVSG